MRRHVVCTLQGRCRPETTFGSELLAVPDVSPRFDSPRDCAERCRSMRSSARVGASVPRWGPDARSLLGRGT